MRTLLLLLLLTASQAFAGWTLDNTGSRLSFVTVKAQNVAEVHSFTQLSGEVNSTGIATVIIQLASVDTLIEVRDERMREVLFQTDVFPAATVSTGIDLAELNTLAAGTSSVVPVELMLSLGGLEFPLTAELLVTRLATDRMLISTFKPIIVNAANVALAEGVEKLREIAGLPSISNAVPVTFVLQFVRES